MKTFISGSGYSERRSINFFVDFIKVCQKIVYVSMVFSKYFLNQHRHSRNQGIVGKLVERQIFLKFQVVV